MRKDRAVSVVAAAFLAGAFMFSCAQQKPVLSDKQPEPAQKHEYVLGSRDVVEITVAGHPELCGRSAIDNNGNIELPLTGDLVKASGLTLEQLSESVADVLTKYVTSRPHLKIKIAEYESKVVYVVGAVASPGKYALREYVVRVRDIIFDAGLPRDDADESRVYIIKPDMSDPSYRTVNLHDILYKGILRENYLLEPGDIVYVRTTALSKFNKVCDQLLTPASKAAAVYYLTTQFANILNPAK